MQLKESIHMAYLNTTFTSQMARKQVAKLQDWLRKGPDEQKKLQSQKSSLIDEKMFRIPTIVPANQSKLYLTLQGISITSPQ